MLEEAISLFAFGEECDPFTLLFRNLQRKTLHHFVTVYVAIFIKTGRDKTVAEIKRNYLSKKPTFIS